MIGYGLFYYFVYGGAVAAPPSEEIKLAEGYVPQALTVFLILGAFSNGCSALTGVEAISNGVQAFKTPESKNASRTLVAMAVLLGIMFCGTSRLRTSSESTRTRTRPSSLNWLDTYSTARLVGSTTSFRRRRPRS